MKKVFTKHNDAAHGWLEVSYKDVTDLNIQNEISEFSYINKTCLLYTSDAADE